MPNITEIIAYPGLSGVGTSLPSAGTQGRVLYDNGTAWTILEPGTASQLLITGGAAANPSWSNVPKLGVIAEAVTDAGITLDGVNLKDGGGTFTATITGTAATLSGLTTTNTLSVGSTSTLTGNVTFGASALVDTITEKTSAAGVTIEGVEVKDNNVTVGTSGVVYTDTITEKVAAAGVTIDGVLLKDNDVTVGTSGSVVTDTIAEKASAAGVTVDGVLLKDGGATITGNLTGVNKGTVIAVNPDHPGATDTRTGLGAYDPNRPFVTIQAAINAASVGGDLISLDSSAFVEDVTITDKSLLIYSSVGSTGITGNITTTHSANINTSVSLRDITFLKVSAAPLIMSGSWGTVSAYRCGFWGVLAAAFTQSSTNHVISSVGSIMTGTASSSVTGQLTLDVNSRFDGDLAGAGLLTMYSQAIHEGSRTTTSIVYAGDGTTFLHELQTDSISEKTSTNGVDIDGTKLKDGGITAAYIKPGLTTKTTTYTALITDHTIICDASGGAFTVTLPAAATCTDLILIIKKNEASANAVTIDGNASETIDSAATKILSSSMESATLQSDGTEWWIL